MGTREGLAERAGLRCVRHALREKGIDDDAQAAWLAASLGIALRRAQRILVAGGERKTMLRIASLLGLSEAAVLPQIAFSDAPQVVNACNLLRQLDYSEHEFVEALSEKTGMSEARCKRFFEGAQSLQTFELVARQLGLAGPNELLSISKSRLVPHPWASIYLPWGATYGTIWREPHTSIPFDHRDLYADLSAHDAGVIVAPYQQLRPGALYRVVRYETDGQHPASVGCRTLIYAEGDWYGELRAAEAMLQRHGVSMTLINSLAKLPEPMQFDAVIIASRNPIADSKRVNSAAAYPRPTVILAQTGQLILQDCPTQCRAIAYDTKDLIKQLRTVFHFKPVQRALYDPI